jgi:cobalt-zinc-cadmium efflux system outer membrane protein
MNKKRKANMTRRLPIVLTGLLFVAVATLADRAVFADAEGAVVVRAEPQRPDSTVTFETMTLDQVVDAALRANPQVHSTRARWEAMSERPAQEGALPNPTFQYGGMDDIDGGSWPNTDEKRFMVEQPFPWFGKRGLREKIAATEAETMGSEYDATVRDVIMMVKESYFELYSVQRSLDITRAEKNVLEQMQKIAEARYATGEVNQQDAVKAQAEVSMIEAKILDLEQEEIGFKGRLNQLLNRRADFPLGRAVTDPQRGVEFNAKNLFDLAEKTRPEIKDARLQIEREEDQHALVKKESFPDYRLGLEYRSFRRGEDMLMFTLGFDLPIWRNKNRAGVRESERMIESRRAGLETVEKQISFDVLDAYTKLLAGQRLADLYETALIPQAQARFDASEAEYRTGKANFLDLLESERFLLSARLMSATAEGQLGVLLARLERAVGTDLKDGVPSETQAPDGTPEQTPQQTPEHGHDE